jgi:hypothetical protein
MAIPWLVVLQSVPWTEVIKNAPKVAEGAKKLWNTVAKKPAAPVFPAVATPIPIDADPLSVLQARVVALEAITVDLHTQMLASSELIKTLAEQNTQLIAHIEANRVHAKRLAVLMTVFGVVACSALVVALRH